MVWSFIMSRNASRNWKILLQYFGFTEWNKVAFWFNQWVFCKIFENEYFRDDMDWFDCWNTDKVDIFLKFFSVACAEVNDLCTSRRITVRYDCTMILS